MTAPNYGSNNPSQFRQDKDVADEGFSWFPSDNKIPFKSESATALKQAQIDNARLVNNYQCELFDLTDAEQLKRFHVTMNRIYGGWYLKLHLERRWDVNKAKPLVWLEWLVRYYVP
jgi:hypothetical protein